MRFTDCVLLAWLGLAAASPLRVDKRYVVTDVIMETATVTVTASPGRSGSPTQPGLSISPLSTTTTMVTTIATITVPNTASPPSQASSTNTLSPYAAPILQQHNIHRENQSSPDLVWDDNLANIAAQIASTCHYAHNTSAGGGGYGQNIGAGAPGSDVPKMITNQMFNDEMMLYPGYGKEPDMSNFEAWGHYSQIVWKATTSVGCFTQYCANGLSGVGDNVSPYFTVCNYKPPGNVGGAYAANVLKPLGQSVVLL